MREEIYSYLKELKELNAYSYSYLIKKYDEKLVNEIIESLIEENNDNLIKYDYYVKKVIACDDLKVNNAFDAYISEMGKLKTYTNEDNDRDIKEITNIMNEIKGILLRYGDVDDSMWLSDRIDNFIQSNPDYNDLVEVKRLYKIFCDKRNDIVSGNLRFVIYVAKKYIKVSKEFEELVQYGNIGLMKAIEKYDISYNVNFTTYAYYWIMQSITRYGTLDSMPITVSHRLININLSIKKAKYELTMLYGRKPTDEEVAKHLNISIDLLNEVSCAFSRFVSLDDTLAVDESDDMLKNFIPDYNVNVEKEVIDGELVKDVREFLKNNLNERDYNVICHRFALDNHKFLSLQELGDMYGLSRERIRQIEFNSLARLKGKGRILRSYVER